MSLLSTWCLLACLCVLFAEGQSTVKITGNVPVFADGTMSLVLTCTASIVTNATFQWRNGGSIVGTNTSTLSFSPVRASDNEANITCTVIKQPSDSVILTVHYGPSSVSITGNTPVYDNNGNKLTLTCTAKDFSPDVGFQWKEGSQNISGENAKTFTKIADKTDNRKMIGCLTWNIQYPSKMKETSVQLTVYYAPSGPIITGHSNAQILKENDDSKSTVALTCTAAGGYPVPKLTWSGPCSIDGGTVISQLIRSTVQITRSINQKTCTCAGTQSNTPWTGQSDVTFKVHFGPDIIQITTDTNILLENKTVAITCRTTEANPSKKIMWYNGTEVISVNSKYNRQTGNNHGTVTSQTWNRQLSWYDDKSVIKCATTNQLGGFVSDSKELDVKHGPKDIIIRAPRLAIEGDNITVTCSCHSNPDPSFIITSPTSRLIVRTNRLEVQNISHLEGGEYSCTARNMYFTETKTTTVIVNYPPDITITYSNATENDTGVTIRCAAAGTPQSYNFVSWKHIAPDRQTIIRELGGVQNEEQLILTFPTPVSYEDSGYYECTVNNGVKGRSPQLDQTKLSDYFIVEGSPKILEKQDSVQCDIGVAAKLEVRFYSVPGYTSLNWYTLDGNNLTDPRKTNVTETLDTWQTTFHGHNVNVSGYITTLQIDNVTEADFVSYKMVVNNNKGSASFVKTLKGINTNLSSSVVIGAVVGTLVAVLLLVAVVLLFLWRRGIFLRFCKKKNIYENNKWPETQPGVTIKNNQPCGPKEDPGTPYENLSVLKDTSKKQPKSNKFQPGGRTEDPGTHYVNQSVLKDTSKSNKFQPGGRTEDPGTHYVNQSYKKDNPESNKFQPGGRTEDPGTHYVNESSSKEQLERKHENKHTGISADEYEQVADCKRFRKNVPLKKDEVEYENTVLNRRN